MAKRKKVPAVEMKEMDMETFQALSAAEKERIYQEIDSQTPEQMRAESRPLTPAERRRLATFRRGLGLRGRPKVKEGAKAVSVTIEQGLLRRADTWAKQHDMSRAQLMARGLELAMGGGGWTPVEKLR